MKLILSVCVLLCLQSLSQAQGVRYTIQNQTGGLGGPTYPVTTPVAFSTVNLVLTYADHSTVTENLTGIPATTSKNSSIYALTDPVRGAITNATVSGLFSTLNWQESPTFLGPKTSVTVLNPFSVTLPGGILQFGFLDGITSSGTHYHAGNFSSGPASLPVTTPEPGNIAFLLSGIVFLACLRKRTPRI